MLKDDIHIFQGMQRDSAMSRQQPLFLWDAHNVRMTDRGDNTLMSITNEKGNEKVVGAMAGVYLGHCIINNSLILFSYCNTSSHITKVTKSYLNGDVTYSTQLLYNGNLGFDQDHPIETLASYETESILKVYWVDGKNQPRVINVADASTIIPDNDTQFDFVLKLKLEETVSVSRILGLGMFSPGTVQYAFSYYRLHGQQSNIFATTPLQYIALTDRGGSPEEVVSCSFLITLDNLDTNFDYVRIYSIHRTSLNAVPTVKRVVDLEVKNNVNNVLQYTDTGTNGDVIDAYELLYIGGRSIKAHTLSEKDNTLFIGGIELESKEKEILDYMGSHKVNWNLSPDKGKGWNNPIEYGSYYSYAPEGVREYSAGFKTNEVYRIGIQALLSDGRWLEPIFIKDEILSSTYPQTLQGFIQWSTKNISVPSSDLNWLRGNGVIKLRPCIVFPTIADRNILCQGVLNPTVFRGTDRADNMPFAQSSWFFRPAMKDLPTSLNVFGSHTKGSSILFRHFKHFLKGYGSEVLGDGANPDNFEITQSLDFYVDENLLTFNSPDVEFDDLFPNLDYLNLKLKIIGVASLSSIRGNTTCEASPGHNGQYEYSADYGYAIGDTDEKAYNNGGLVSVTSYRDCLISKDVSDNNYYWPTTYFLTYPWHRQGSLNNDTARSTDEKYSLSAVLKKKILSNLKFFGFNTPLTAPIDIRISVPLLFYSDLMRLEKVKIPYLLNADAAYYGNIDTLISSLGLYDIIGSSLNRGEFSPPNLDIVGLGVDNINLTDYIIKGNEPVRMKYKSAPHLVFSLKSSDSTKIELLPRALDFITSDDTPDLANAFNDDYHYNGVNADRSIYYLALDLDTLRLARPGWFAGAIVYNNGNLLVYGYTPRGRDAGWHLGTFSVGETILFNFGYNYVQGTIPALMSIMLGLGDRTYTDEVVQGSGSKLYKVTAVSDGCATALEELQSQQLTVIQNLQYNRQSINQTIPNNPYLVIAELVKDVQYDNERFGGTTPDALKLNLWMPAGEPFIIPETPTLDAKLLYLYGDTWYSRYDCLKTYPFTDEDPNLVIEIGSFLLETRVNIDGRYDRNRGSLNNLAVSPLNFNLMNGVYTQKDNYFVSRKLGDDYYKDNKFLALFTWSKEKSPSADIDLWTNITLSSTYDLKGDKGILNKIITLGDLIYCFQDHAIHLILFNSRVQVPVSDGVPIEITNGNKLEGTRIIQEHIGCLNKWSICSTPSGIYFIDNFSNSIYLFDGQQCQDLSTYLGLSSWVGLQYTPYKWLPRSTGDAYNGIKTFYDYEKRDVYFVPGKDNSGREALCYNEILKQFTSFMNYEKTPAMFNWLNGFYSLWSIYDDESNVCHTTSLWRNFVDGKYNNIYGIDRPFSFSFISNAEPESNKIFDTIEYRADIWDYQDSMPKLKSDPVFDYIRVENEYQDTELQALNTARRYISRESDASVRYKGRTWRAIVPRNSSTRLRIRNPWAKITLGYKSTKGNVKVLIHDLRVRYSL